MKSTRAIALLSQELCHAEHVVEWIVDQDDEDSYDLHCLEEWCEVLRMAIRALGGATV